MADLGATSTAATQPAFADAGQTADNQKQALLQAIAQAGQAGRQQYQTMQASNAADRQAALQAATQREAVVQNMPPALAQELGVKTAQPFDLGQQLYQEGQQSQVNNMTQLSAAGGNYLSELKASIPVVQADVQSKVAALQEASNQKAAQMALDLQLKQLDVQAAQQRAQASSAQDNVTKFVQRAGGIQTAGDSLQQNMDQWVQQQLSMERTGGVGSGAPDQAGLQQQFLDSVDKYNGWSSGTAKSIIDQGTTKGASAQATLQNKQDQISKYQISTQQQKNGVSDPRYNEALQLVQNAAETSKSQVTSDALLKYLESKGISPDTAMTAINSYANMQNKGAGIQTGQG